MNYTDNTDGYYFSITQETAATSNCQIYPRFIPAGTTTSIKIDNWHSLEIPKSSKKTKSKWLNKKLKKLGR